MNVKTLAQIIQRKRIWSRTEADGYTEEFVNGYNLKEADKCDHGLN